MGKGRKRQEELELEKIKVPVLGRLSVSKKRGVHLCSV